MDDGQGGAAGGAGSRDFALCLNEGNPRFVFSFKDQGVTIDARVLAWTCKDVAQRKAFGEIEAIRLRVMPTPGANTGQCTITFAGGLVLNVMSWTPAGFADPERAKIYRDFVLALHAALPPADRARIAFTSGFPGAGAAWQRYLGTGALIAAFLVFVMAPLGLALVTGDMQGYYLAAGGAMLTTGLFWQVRRGAALNAVNKPRSYSADRVPAGLMP